MVKLIAEMVKIVDTTDRTTSPIFVFYCHIPKLLIPKEIFNTVIPLTGKSIL